MKNPITYLILSVFWFGLSCSREDVAFEPGQYWLNDFDKAALQNITLHKDKLYCNTVYHPSGDFLYCLNLKSGKVDWKVPVDNFAPEPVLINDQIIYYTTFVGHIYCISLEGKLLCDQKMSSTFSGQEINPYNGNLIINSVVNGAREYNRDSLKEVFHYKFDGKDGLCSLSKPAFYDSLIIFGNVEIDSITGEKGLIAIGQKTKGIIWKTKMDSDIKSKYEGTNMDIYLETINNYLIALDYFNRNKILFVINCKDGNEVKLNKKRLKSFKHLIQSNIPKKQKYYVVTKEGSYSVELQPINNTTEMEVIINQE